MKYTTQTIFESIRPALPPGLSSRILSSIDQEIFTRNQYRARVAAWSAVLSLAVFLASLNVAGRDFFASGFWQLISLLISDLSFILSHSEDFLLSLAETFPATSVTLFLVPLFFAALSLIFRSKYIQLSEAWQRESRFHNAH